MSENGPNQLRTAQEVPAPVHSRRALIPFATQKLEETVRKEGSHSPLPNSLFAAKEVQFDEGLNDDSLQEAA